MKRHLINIIYWLVEKLAKLASSISDVKMDPATAERVTISTYAFAVARKDMPCKACHGQGGRIVDDEIYICKRCKGTQIDPEYFISDGVVMFAGPSKGKVH